LSWSESLRVVREPCVGGLERDFGSDPELLARQVEGTLRHEVAHHLGYDEPGVAALGL
jgi:predicted Zn-dependent protease with MMP-like domain